MTPNELSNQMFEALVWFIENDETWIGLRDEQGHALNGLFEQGLTKGVAAVRAYCEQHDIRVPQSVVDKEQHLQESKKT